MGLSPCKNIYLFKLSVNTLRETEGLTDEAKIFACLPILLACMPALLACSACLLACLPSIFLKKIFFWKILKKIFFWKI